MLDSLEARQQMVDTQLAPNAVTDKRLLGAMRTVPRETFLPPARLALAYSDAEHPLAAANGRVLPTPTAFAQLVQLGAIGPLDVVLDVGCGTGYSTAILAQLASAVVAIEDDQSLVARADELLTKLEISNAAVLKADLSKGVPSEAPFDVIVIEGQVDDVPKALLTQLKDGGRLVTSVSHGKSGFARVFQKSGSDVTARESFNLNMPELAAFGAETAFAF